MEVNKDDLSIWSNDAGKYGYFNGDMDMNCQVTHQDKNDVWLDNSGKVEMLPE